MSNIIEDPLFLPKGTTFEDIVNRIGFTPQAGDDRWCVWVWYINGVRCSIHGVKRSPDDQYQFGFYGPAWMAEGLFSETDELLSSRYE